MIELSSISEDALALTMLQLECHFADEAWCQEYSKATLVYCDGDYETHEYAQDAYNPSHKYWWAYGPGGAVAKGLQIHFDMTKEAGREEIRQILRGQRFNCLRLYEQRGETGLKLRAYS